MDKKLIVREDAAGRVMEYAALLRRAGNEKAAGYVMWAADIIREYPSIDGLNKESVPAGLYKQILWERDVAIKQLQSYGIVLGEKTDAKKVNHGHWIYKGVRAGLASFDCSECSKHVVFDHFTKECTYEYCPHCGAQMDDNDCKE